MYKVLDKVNSPEDIKQFTAEQIQDLCTDIRLFIMDSVSKTGGHLGSSLGTIELAVALHYVYNSPIDKIIWDIGHQSYAHKILTGQKDSFNVLRQYQGISGFTNPFENPHDFFIGGHSSVAISNAMGLKQSMLMQESNASVITVIGDSAISSGVAFEALNHLGSEKYKLLVILNDNNMSISKTTGALSNYFAKIKTSNPMVNLKNFIKHSMPKPMLDVVKKINSLSMNQPNLFDDLGFEYIGPLDGHDTALLIAILNNIKSLPDNKPILLHIITSKGRGHGNAESSDDRLHGVEGENANIQSHQSNTDFFAENLEGLIEKNNKIIAITAAMKKGTGLERIAKKYPQQVFDVGIAEQHAVSFAAGLAKGAMIPFVCIYATFMQRAYDQVIHDIILAHLPVRFALDRAGLVGADGITHHGLLDYAMFLPLPNIVFMVPSMQKDIAPMLKLMVKINSKPSFIRYSKNYAPNLADINSKIILGKGRIVRQGEKIALLSLGGLLHDSLEVAEELQSTDNLKITVADAVFAKPVDEDLIINLASNHEVLIIVEEGFSSIFANLVIAVLIKNNLLHTLKINSICVKNFVLQGSIQQQKKMAQINSSNICQMVRDYI